MNTQEKIEKLVELLDSIQGRTDLCFNDPEYPMRMFNKNIINDSNNPNYGVFNEIEDLCCSLFITEYGCPNFYNIDQIEKYHYYVFRGDGDSFGWLTGCIQKDDGPIWVFG